MKKIKKAEKRMRQLPSILRMSSFTERIPDPGSGD